MPQIGSIQEFDLIACLLEALGPQPEVVGLNSQVRLYAGDDCAALVSQPGSLTLYTTDTMVSGVHFLPNMPPRSLGWKSMASNISDIAAMGGAPTMALVTVAAPPTWELDWLLEWYRGMAECARQYNTAILGGDVVRTLSDGLITVSLSGEVEPDRLITRSGAQPGDRILVTGNPGQSGAGLALMLAGKPIPEVLYAAHLHPEPRTLEARCATQTEGITAMIDLSDGMGGDLPHLCQASGTGALIREDLLPISDETLRAAIEVGQDALTLALSGGEDYELLMCVDPALVADVQRAVAEVGRTEAVEIGEITANSGSVLIQRPGDPPRPMAGGYMHF